LSEKNVSKEGKAGKFPANENTVRSRKKGDGRMRVYTLTVFEQNGEKLLDENMEAANDTEAKKAGENRLEELHFTDKTHRFTSPEGKLLLFHR
jgi:hypothetical protein